MHLMAQLQVFCFLFVFFCVALGDYCPTRAEDGTLTAEGVTVTLSELRLLRCLNIWQRTYFDGFAEMQWAILSNTNPTPQFTLIPATITTPGDADLYKRYYQYKVKTDSFIERQYASAQVQLANQKPVVTENELYLYEQQQLEDGNLLVTGNTITQNVHSEDSLHNSLDLAKSIWATLYPDQPFYDSTSVYLYTFNNPCPNCNGLLVNKYAQGGLTPYVGYSRYYSSEDLEENFTNLRTLLNAGWRVELISTITWRTTPLVIEWEQAPGWLPDDSKRHVLPPTIVDNKVDESQQDTLEYHMTNSLFAQGFCAGCINRYATIYAFIHRAIAGIVTLTNNLRDSEEWMKFLQAKKNYEVAEGYAEAVQRMLKVALVNSPVPDVPSAKVASASISKCLDDERVIQGNYCFLQDEEPQHAAQPHYPAHSSAHKKHQRDSSEKDHYSQQHASKSLRHGRT